MLAPIVDRAAVVTVERVIPPPPPVNSIPLIVLVVRLLTDAFSVNSSDAEMLDIFPITLVIELAVKELVLIEENNPDSGVFINELIGSPLRLLSPIITSASTIVVLIVETAFTVLRATRVFAVIVEALRVLKFPNKELIVDASSTFVETAAEFTVVISPIGVSSLTGKVTVLSALNTAASLLPLPIFTAKGAALTKGFPCISTEVTAGKKDQPAAST
jgi:hypothetical protein